MSGGRMTVNDELEGSGCDLFKGTVPEFFYID
jgi:hypothetical protein